MSKLTDKAKGISFEDVDEAPRDEPVVLDRPRTAMGAISASIAMGRGLEAENRDLRAKLVQFEDAVVVEFLDPGRVKPSRFANRHELSFAGVEFERLKAEIAAAGRNVQPIKVRRIGAPGDAQGEFEIVFGHRRHRACLEIGIPVAAIVEELSDAELFVEMERENRERQDLSPWEQGVMYRRALDEKLFPSLRKLAASIGVQVGNVSTAIQLASLPDEVVAAFPSPLVLQFRWAGQLKAVLDSRPADVLREARALAAVTPRLPAKDVLQRLTTVVGSDSASPGSGVGAPEVLSSKGKPAGQLERDARGNLVIRIKSGVLTAAQERRLTEFLHKLLG